MQCTERSSVLEGRNVGHEHLRMVSMRFMKSHDVQRDALSRKHAHLLQILGKLANVTCLTSQTHTITETEAERLSSVFTVL